MRPTTGDQRIKITIRITITRRSPHQNCHAPRFTDRNAKWLSITGSFRIITLSGTHPPRFMNLETLARTTVT